jgi:hypothetical protein
MQGESERIPAFQYLHNQTTGNMKNPEGDVPKTYLLDITRH